MSGQSSPPACLLHHRNRHHHGRTIVEGFVERRLLGQQNRHHHYQDAPRIGFAELPAKVGQISPFSEQLCYRRILPSKSDHCVGSNLNASPLFPAALSPYPSPSVSLH